MTCDTRGIHGNITVVAVWSCAEAVCIMPTGVPTLLTDHIVRAIACLCAHPREEMCVCVCVCVCALCRFMADLHQEALIMMNSMADAGGLLVMHGTHTHTHDTHARVSCAHTRVYMFACACMCVCAPS